MPAEEAYGIKSVGRRHMNALLMGILGQEAPFKVDPKQLLSGGDAGLEGSNFSLSRPTVTDFLCVKITFSDNITSFCLGGSGWFVAIFFQGVAFFSPISVNNTLAIFFFFFKAGKCRAWIWYSPVSDQQCRGCLRQSMKLLCQHRFAKIR